MTDKQKKSVKRRASVQPINNPPSETYEASKARLAAELSLGGLDDNERAFLAVCQNIYRRDHGYTTPFEEFFLSLVLWDEQGRRPTPDLVVEELKIFRSHWNDMKRDTSEFAKAYGERIAEHQETESNKIAARA